MTEILASVASHLANMFAPAGTANEPPQPGMTRVFQIGAFPIPIDPSLYKGAFGPTAPAGSGGNYIPLRRFYNLVDRIPYFGKTYFPSAFSTDITYGQLLDRSTLDKETPQPVKKAYADARLSYQLAALDDGTGSGAKWRPHFPDVDNWWDVGTSSPMLTVKAGLPAKPSTAVVLPGQHDLVWRLENFAGSAVLSQETTVTEISFRYGFVPIRRPWLDLLLLLQVHKYLVIDGIAAGALSSGSFESNQGFFPLLTIGVCIVADVRVTASWGQRDRSIVDLLRKGVVRGSLGPFALGTASKPADMGTLSKELDPLLADELLRETSMAAAPVPYAPAGVTHPLTAHVVDVGIKTDSLVVDSFGDGPIWGPPKDPFDIHPKMPQPAVIIKYPPIALPTPVVPDANTVVYPGTQVVGWVNVLLPKMPR